jgi:hypothetical protein
VGGDRHQSRRNSFGVLQDFALPLAATAAI